MNNELKAKLIKSLKNALRPNYPITADTLKLALSDIRALLDGLGERERYSTLAFHCDWVLHANLTNPRVKKLIKIVDDDAVKAMRRAGLTNWEDQPNPPSSNFWTVSPEFMNELGQFALSNFRSELREFLARHHIVAVALDPAIDIPFIATYCQLVIGVDWDYVNKKLPVKYINRVRVSMQRVADDPNAIVQNKPFPYCLVWSFIWGEEVRLALVAEFVR
jgi:hypothetical protein